MRGATGSIRIWGSERAGARSLPQIRGFITAIPEEPKRQLPERMQDLLALPVIVLSTAQVNILSTAAVSSARLLTW
jgi:hypothetical protein